MKVKARAAPSARLEARHYERKNCLKSSCYRRGLLSLLCVDQEQIASQITPGTEQGSKVKPQSSGRWGERKSDAAGLIHDFSCSKSDSHILSNSDRLSHRLCSHRYWSLNHHYRMLCFHNGYMRFHWNRMWYFRMCCMSQPR